MNAKLKRLLGPILREAKKSPKFKIRSAAEQAIFYVQRAPSARKKPARERKQAKAATHREATALLRHAVFQRAEGKCEKCRQPWVNCDPGEMDHWLSGTGRRRQRQAVETCWALCRGCHWLRTNNEPSAEYWNDQFRAHCENWGYPFVPHITHEPVPARVP